MITINDKSSRTPIFIERDILNKNEKPSNDYVNSDELDEILSGYITDNELNNKGYVTESELQEQLKNIDNIPYIVVDHIQFDDGSWGYGIVSGDYNGVLQAIKENKPQIIYIPYENSGTYLLPHSFQYNSIQDGIYVSTNVHNAVDMNFYYYVYLIKENSVEQTVRETRYVQEKLVSGENIKTINGQNILGEGNIDIPVVGPVTPGPIIPRPPMFDDGTSADYAYVVEVTQSQYDNLTEKFENTFYIITDAPAVEIPDTSEFITESELNSKGYTTSNSFKTINNQSIVGSGNITIEGGSGTEILYLWKETGPSYNNQKLIENANIYEYITSLYPSENYPLLVLRDNWNDTICNNVWSNGYSVEIQCCNSRIVGSRVELTDERFYLQSDGKLSKIESKKLATQNYVDEQIGDINSVLENIIG